MHSTADRKVDFATSSFFIVVIHGAVPFSTLYTFYMSVFFVRSTSLFRLFACSDLDFFFPADWNRCRCTTLHRHTLYEMFCQYVLFGLLKWQHIDENYMTFRHCTRRTTIYCPKIKTTIILQFPWKDFVAGKSWNSNIFRWILEKGRPSSRFLFYFLVLSAGLMLLLPSFLQPLSGTQNILRSLLFFLLSYIQCTFC